VQVLIDNELAEHVPGCNMAFRKHALEVIGGFNPIYRTAGDDVDVCWKLLERGEKLAFSPAALVWHHRRPSEREYLRLRAGGGAPGGPVPGAIPDAGGRLLARQRV
jgi:O-antigen biosynthesis protein